MTREINSQDGYLSRLLKYIPSEIVMVYIAVEGVLRGAYTATPERLQISLWVLTGALLILTPLWLWRVMRIKRLGHLFLSTISLAVWMFAIGGPFTMLDWYSPSLGGVALPLYTLLVPIITGSDLK